MYFGRHKVTPAVQVLDLNEDEEKLLGGDGPKAWFKVEKVTEENKVIKKKTTKKKVTKKKAS